MTGETETAPLDSAPDRLRAARKPIFFRIGFIFSLLGLAAPLAVWLIARMIYKLPCCGEGGTPGDGLGWMLLMIYAIAWWTLTAFFSCGLTLAGLARKERGRMKVPALAAAALSLVSLGLIYAAAIALVLRNL